MKTSIKPMVRKDGVSFVDSEHFADGSPIMSWTCGSCDKTFQEVCRCGTDCERKDEVTYEVIGGFYGPNGNGFNYWCRNCGSRATPDKNKYNPLKQFTEGHQ